MTTKTQLEPIGLAAADFPLIAAGLRLAANRHDDLATERERGASLVAEKLELQAEHLRTLARAFDNV
jgi:hypothetical protein